MYSGDIPLFWRMGISWEMADLTLGSEMGMIRFPFRNSVGSLFSLKMTRAFFFNWVRVSLSRVVSWVSMGENIVRGRGVEWGIFYGEDFLGDDFPCFSGGKF